MVELLERIAKAVESSPIPSSIPNGMKAEQAEKTQVSRIIESALKPSDWVNRYLDEYPDRENLAGQSNGIRYEDLAQMISDYAGMHIPKTTVYRICQKRKVK